METNKQLKKLKKSWAYYTVICLFLLIVNFMVSPAHFWVLWVVLGWGVAMIIQTINYKFGDEQEK